MTPAESTRLIDKAGGNTGFAALLGITEQPGFQQRVTNWRRRGIPAAVVLEHQDKLRALQAQPDTNAAA